MFLLEMHGISFVRIHKMNHQRLFSYLSFLCLSNLLKWLNISCGKLKYLCRHNFVDTLDEYDLKIM
jgi:hypothetical protein